MTRAYANIEGHTVTHASIHVPNVGPWWADLIFEQAPDLSGRVTLEVGELRLSGTLQENGTFGLQRRARIVAGAGGWGTLVPALHYHNDAQINARTVAEDAARIAGETLGAFAPEETTIGIDYAREAGVASRVLEDVIGAVPWYVGYTGETVVGSRSSALLDPDLYEVLDYDPHQRLATLALDDVGAISVGSRIEKRLDDPQIVNELRIEIAPESVRVIAYTGGSLQTRGRLASLFRDAVKRVAADRLFGVYRYRVVKMSVDRVELQAVAQGAGLADAQPISMWAGVAGAHSKLTPGSQVLVQFVEGRRTMPIITNFIGKDQGGDGHPADETDLSVATILRLGDSGAVDPVALAPGIDSQLDDLNAAMDAFVTAVPLAPPAVDNGAALQAAVIAAWGSGTPARPASNVGASKVVAK